jgi:hypothetical protein
MKHEPGTPATRDAGRARVGHLTLLAAAGGITGVGVLSGLAAASTHSSSRPPAPVPSWAPAPSSSDGVLAVPGTVPATAVPAPGHPSTSIAPPATSPPAAVVTDPPLVIQPPTSAPSTHRHRRPVASSGGS